MKRKKVMTQSLWTKTTCAYCGVGCGIEAKPNSNGLLDIRGDKEHPANFGRLCSKGLALGETVVTDGRLLSPMTRDDKNSIIKKSSWDDALTKVAKTFKETIAEHGPDSVAFYVSGQLLTEDYYLANKLMKGFIGSGNIDSNSRLCMASTVVGHKRAFGTDTVPVCYEDIELSDMVIITGSNLAWCHPVLFQRLKAAKLARPELFVVVIDPRKTASCEIADLHLPISLGADVALFNGLLAYLADNKKLDESFIAKFTEGFDEVINADGIVNQEALLSVTGLTNEQVTEFYQKFSTTDKVLTIYSQGVNQSSQGSDKVNSIINCHLATGKIGKPGTGPFSVTGQPNAMGGREVGALANTLAAHMEFGNEEHNELISEFWQTNTLAKQPGLKAVDLFDAMHQGKIKAVWIMATNPVVSLPNNQKVIEALKKCPLVVVSDCIEDTATTAYADVLLPAQSWSEKSGTVTNSERRISRQRRILPTKGEGKADWWIINQVARRMGFEKAFNFKHEGDVFREHSQVSLLGNEHGKSRDFYLGALSVLSDAAYKNLKPQQWPIATEVTGEITKKPVSSGNHRFFTDNRFFTPSKKAQFISVLAKQPQAMSEQKLILKAEGAKSTTFLLNTGRIRDHWHTMTRTGLSSRLSAHMSEPYVSINIYDATRLSLLADNLVRINSAQGEVVVRVSVNNDVNRGELFVPIHWNKTSASQGNVSRLIPEVTDVISGQPEYKCTSVQLEKVAYQSEGLLLVKTPLHESMLKPFSYWVKQTVDQGYLYRLCSTGLPSELKAEIEKIISALDTNKQGKEVNYYPGCEAGEQTYRFAYIVEQQVNTAYLVSDNFSGKTLSWFELLLATPVDKAVKRTIISGQVQGILAQGKIICACKQVGESTIEKAIEEYDIDDPQMICDKTGAGTGCGSCMVDVESILAKCCA